MLERCSTKCQFIHAYDCGPLAEDALEAAERYAKSASVVPHAIHMPSHT